MDEEQQQPQPERRYQRWHFDRRIGWDTLLGVVGVIGVVYATGNSIVNEMRTANAQMDKRVSILEVKQENQGKIDERQDQVIIQGQARTEDSLREIRNKLDRVANGTK